MPKQVIVTTLWTCSLCTLQTEEEKITPYTIRGDGANLSIDICATCKGSEPWAGILAVGLSEKAASTGLTFDSDGRVPCEFCGKPYTPQGMGLHKKTAHNVKSATDALMERRGKAGKFECETCGFRTVNVQGLGAHKRSKHAVVGTSKTATLHRAKAAK